MIDNSGHKVHYIDLSNSQRGAHTERFRMNITRKIQEDKKIIISADIEFNGETAKLNLIGELGGFHGDSFGFRFSVDTKENLYSGHGGNLKSWTISEKQTYASYTYSIQSKFAEFLNERGNQLQEQLREHK